MTRRRWITAAVLLAACAPAPWLPGAWATLRWFALCVAPGATLLLLLCPAIFRDAARATVAVLLGSALLAPLSYFALLRLTGGPDAALAPYALGWGLLLAGAYLWNGERRRGRGSVGAGSRGRTLLTLALLGALITLPLLLRSELRLRSDAWTHIAIVREILTRPYPWNDPRFAGEPLRYFWFLNAWASGFAARGGTSIPWALALTQYAQAVAFVAALWTAAASLFPATAQRRAAVAVGLFGLNPLGLYGVVTHWLQGAIGATRRPDAGEAFIGQLRFADAGVIHTLTPYGTSFVAWIDKFLVVTAFGIGMTAALLLATLVWEAARGGRFTREQALLFGIGFAAVLCHHPVAAAFLGFTLGAALLVPRLLGRAGLDWRDTALALALLAAVTLATLPYQASILAGREAAGETGYGFGLQRVWWLTTLTAAGPLLALLWLGRRPLRGALGSAAPHFAAFVAAALALMLFVSLPSVNENKLIILFFCAAAPAGGAGLLALRDALRPRAAGRALGYALAAGAIAVPLLLWIGHALHREPPVPPAVAEACAWARADTPTDAIFIEPEGRRFLMNRVERDMLASDRTFVRECGYAREPILERLALIERLYATGALSGADRERLTALGRPVYACYLKTERPEGDDREAPRPGVGDFVRVFRNAGAEIYRFKAGGQAPGEGRP